MTSIYDYILFSSEDNSFLDLPKEEYKTLINQGRVAHTWPDGVERPYLCLIREEEREGVSDFYNLSYQPDIALPFLLDHAYLARPRQVDPYDLDLVDPGPLREAVLHCLPPKPPNPMEYLSIYQALFDKTLQHIFPFAQKAVRETGQYLGELSVCTCEEPACAAACGWIERYTGLVYVDSGSGILIVKAFLPLFIA